MGLTVSGGGKRRGMEAAVIDEDWDADGGCAGWLCSRAFELGICSDGSRHECRGLKHSGGAVIANERR